jgi:hypothetical protein
MKRLYIFILILALIVPVVAFATPETLTSVRGNSGFPVYGRGQAGSMKIAHGQYNVTAAVEDGDIFVLCRIPPGATVVGGRFYADDLDVGTEALDMDIGWAANGTEAADPDGLLNAGTLTGDAVTGVKPETGTSMPLGGVLITAGKASFTNKTAIQAEVNTAANSFTEGTIGVVIFYTMD